MCRKLTTAFSECSSWPLSAGLSILFRCVLMLLFDCSQAFGQKWKEGREVGCQAWQQRAGKGGGGGAAEAGRAGHGEGLLLACLLACSSATYLGGAFNTS